MDERLFSATKQAFEKRTTYPGYPEQRLVLASDFDTYGIIDIPDGPWETTHDIPPTPAETKLFQDAGYETDTLGRPLHPWLKNMITDPAIGVVTGKGKYYHWGPNYTADPIVMTTETRPRVLLIQRSDTGRWALPGGFVDSYETDTEHTARRELREETGIVLPPTVGIPIYQGVVADTRTTAHSWAETAAYLYTVDTIIAAKGQDDAMDATWRYVDELDGTLFGSHAALIAIACEQLKTTG